MIDTATQDQRQHFQDHGYVVVRGAADENQIRTAVAAVNEILDRATAGQYGDQFRWADERQRVPAFINDLLSPSKYDDPALAARGSKRACAVPLSKPPGLSS